MYGRNGRTRRHPRAAGGRWHSEERGYLHLDRHRCPRRRSRRLRDRKSTRLNSSHGYTSYAVFCLKKENLMRSRTGHACNALRNRETVAEALGIPIASYNLIAFVISSALTSVAGCLFAYYRGFVSI